MKIDTPYLSLTDAFEPLRDEDFAGLAGVRLGLRRFLAFSEAAVKSAGITSQQYQAMLAIRASPQRALTIKQLAEELLLKPNGSVQLVDRLAAIAMVRRFVDDDDRRKVLVRLTKSGARLIEVLAAEHLAELVRQRPLLVDSLRRLKKMAG